jgi:hypothetical protein
LFPVRSNHTQFRSNSCFFDVQAIEIYNEKDLKGMFSEQDAASGVTWQIITEHIGSRSLEEVQRFAHAYFEQLRKRSANCVTDASGPVAFKKENLSSNDLNIREGAHSSSGLSDSTSSLQVAYGKEEKLELDEKLMLDSSMLQMTDSSKPKLDLDTAAIPPMAPMGPYKSEDKLELDAASLDDISVVGIEGLPIMIEPVTNCNWGQLGDGAEDSPSMAAAAAAAASAVPDANQYVVPPQAADGGAGNTLRMGLGSVSAFRCGASTAQHSADLQEALARQVEMGVVVHQPRSPRLSGTLEDLSSSQANGATANGAIRGVIGSFRVVDPSPHAIAGQSPVAGGGSRSVSRNSSASSAGSPLSSPNFGKRSPGGSKFTKKLMKTTVRRFLRLPCDVLRLTCVVFVCAGEGTSTG